MSESATSIPTASAGSPGAGSPPSVGAVANPGDSLPPIPLLARIGGFLSWIGWLAAASSTALIFAFQKLDKSPPGCGDASGGCSAVWTTEYAYIAGIGATYWAIAYSALTFVLLVALRKNQSLNLARWTVVITTLGTAGAVWFLNALYFELRLQCVWCVIVHAGNILLWVGSLVRLLGVLIWFTRRKDLDDLEDDPLSPSRFFASFVLTGILLVIQAILFMGLSSAPPLMFTPIENIAEKLGPASSDVVTILGNPQAPVRLVVYSCPTCNKCEKTSKALQVLLAARPNDLFVEQRFFPLNSECNKSWPMLPGRSQNRLACPIVELVLTATAADPSLFHDALKKAYELSEKESTRELEAYCRSLVGSEAFDAARESGKAVKRRDADAATGGAVGVVTVPMIFSSRGYSRGEYTPANLNWLVDHELNFGTRMPAH
jgi:uncharacterized membrane protein/glutaredoxin